MEQEVPTSLSSGGSTSREPHGGVSDSVYCPKGKDTYTRTPTPPNHNDKEFIEIIHNKSNNNIQNHKNQNIPLQKITKPNKETISVSTTLYLKYCTKSISTKPAGQH